MNDLQKQKAEKELELKLSEQITLNQQHLKELTNYRIREMVHKEAVNKIEENNSEIINESDPEIWGKYLYKATRECTMEQLDEAWWIGWITLAMKRSGYEK